MLLWRVYRASWQQWVNCYSSTPRHQRRLPDVHRKRLQYSSNEPATAGVGRRCWLGPNLSTVVSAPHLRSRPLGRGERVSFQVQQWDGPIKRLFRWLRHARRFAGPLPAHRSWTTTSSQICRSGTRSTAPPSCPGLCFPGIYALRIGSSQARRATGPSEPRGPALSLRKIENIMTRHAGPR